MVYRHYLYRHIRLDTNTPFYIGIGTKDKRNHYDWISEYRRAFVKNRKESSIWNNIVAKTEYRVEIMLESDDYSYIKDKEKEFIQLYGRLNINTGILANMTNGGDGFIGYIPSKEKIENHRIKMKGRVTPPEIIQKQKDARRFYKHSEETKQKISNSHKGKLLDKDHHIKLQNGRNKTRSKPVLQYDIDGNFIKEWENATTVERVLGINKCAIRACVFNRVNHAGHFIWVDKKQYTEIPPHIEVSQKAKSLSSWWKSVDRKKKGINLAKQKIKLTDTLSDTEIIFDTLKNCANFLKMNPANFNRLLKKHKLINNRYTYSLL